MDIPCHICLESLQLSNKVFATPCGHLYHISCIKQWLRRYCSTCPYCRKNIQERDLLRIYWCISNDNIVQEDTTAWQHRIEKLLLKISEKDKEIGYLKRDMNFLKNVGVEVNSLRGRNNQLEKKLADSEKKMRISVREKTELLHTKFSLEDELSTARNNYACEHQKWTHSENELASCKSLNVKLEQEVKRLTKRLRREAASPEDKLLQIVLTPIRLFAIYALIERFCGTTAAAVSSIIGLHIYAAQFMDRVSPFVMGVNKPYRDVEAADRMLTSGQERNYERESR